MDDWSLTFAVPFCSKLSPPLTPLHFPSFWSSYTVAGTDFPKADRDILAHTNFLLLLKSPSALGIKKRSHGCDFLGQDCFHLLLVQLLSIPSATGSLNIIPFIFLHNLLSQLSTTLTCTETCPLPPWTKSNAVTIHSCGEGLCLYFSQSTVYLGEEIFLYLSSHEFSLSEILLLGTYRGGQFVC